MTSPGKLRRSLRPGVNRKLQQRANDSETTAQKLRKILERLDRLPILDHRSHDEIIGYDENGVPR